LKKREAPKCFVFICKKRRQPVLGTGNAAGDGRIVHSDHSASLLPFSLPPFFFPASLKSLPFYYEYKQHYVNIIKQLLDDGKEDSKTAEHIFESMLHANTNASVAASFINNFSGQEVPKHEEQLPPSSNKINTISNESSNTKNSSSTTISSISNINITPTGEATSSTRYLASSAEFSPTGERGRWNYKSAFGSWVGPPICANCRRYFGDAPSSSARTDDVIAETVLEHELRSSPGQGCPHCDSGDVGGIHAGKSPKSAEEVRRILPVPSTETSLTQKLCDF